MPFLTQTAVANPQMYTQVEILDKLGLKNDKKAEKIFTKTLIEKRGLALLEGADSLGLEDYNKTTLNAARELCKKAITQLSFSPEELAAVVITTTHSTAIPSIAHYILDDNNLLPSTLKYELCGMGCVGAIPGLVLADKIVTATPSKKVLLVVFDLVSPYLSRMNAASTTEVVGAALFGDGCFAGLVEANTQLLVPRFVDSEVYQIPNTLEEIRFIHSTSNEQHFFLIKELANYIGTYAPDVIRTLLARHNLESTDVTHWICHPGGPAILKAVEGAFNLNQERLAPSYYVLKNFGNMSAPSVLFTLNHFLNTNQPQPGDYGILLAVGPGITLGVALVRW